MQDRQPGAPGQYKAILTAAELQKMQAGEQFTITMVRDDQPIVEGTPYSKAAVLPDALAAIICPDVLNPTPADALSAMLPRNGKSAMTADLPMNGHKVTGLGTPTENGDAVPLGYANKNFAPAGFGLDNNYKTTANAAEADEYRTNGWYRYVNNSGATLVPGFAIYYAAIRVDSYSNSTYVVQTLVAYNYPGCILQRYFKDGTWREWEWINPPMVSGVEYRTMERCEGNPVYAKRIEYISETDVGNTSGVYDIIIGHGISNFGKLVKFYAVKGFYPFPVFAANGGVANINQVSGSAIVVRTYNTTLAAGTLCFDLYYTKT